MAAPASREALRVLAGGAGAALATIAAHFVNVVVGDAVAALIGFVAAYAFAGRWPAVGADPASTREPFGALARPPVWITAGRRIAVVASALALLFGDGALYRLGVHGLPRKLGAVALATATLAVGFWLTRWPRATSSEGASS